MIIHDVFRYAAFNAEQAKISTPTHTHKHTNTHTHTHTHTHMIMKQKKLDMIIYL